MSSVPGLRVCSHHPRGDGTAPRRHAWAAACLTAHGPATGLAAPRRKPLFLLESGSCGLGSLQGDNLSTEARGAGHVQPAGASRQRQRGGRRPAGGARCTTASVSPRVRAAQEVPAGSSLGPPGLSTWHPGDAGFMRRRGAWPGPSALQPPGLCSLTPGLPDSVHLLLCGPSLSCCRVSEPQETSTGRKWVDRWCLRVRPPRRGAPRPLRARNMGRP